MRIVQTYTILKFNARIEKKMGEIKVNLIETLGTDLTVVNAARVSFDKHHSKFTDGDEKLISYLAQHGHWTPFGHPQLQFRISAPVFVARQLVKHQVGLVWNEVSRRYVDTPPTFYYTDTWRKKATDKKQGSSDEEVHLHLRLKDDLIYIQEKAAQLYAELLRKGVAPEQARMILPQSMFTEWYWTGSLYAFTRVCKLRLSNDAQEETREVAKLLSNELKKSFPISCKYLLEE